MCTSYLKVVLALVASVPLIARAQSSSPPPPEAVVLAATESVPTKNTLFKLGTGLTRGINSGSYSGLTVPIVLGVEHHVTPAIALYGNLFGAVSIGRRSDADRYLLREIGAEAGARYYYNQEKRRLKGHATGPFAGNYVALHTDASVYSKRYQYPSREVYRYTYDYSSVNLLWGMQRRIGSHGLFDLYAGVGVANHYNRRYFSDNPLGPNIVSGVKISLVP